MTSESKEMVEAPQTPQSHSTYILSSSQQYNHLRVHGVQSQSKSINKFGLIKIRDEVKVRSRKSNFRES